MQLFVNREPVRGRDFVRADLGARRLGEDLGGAAVDVIEAGGFEHAETICGNDRRWRFAMYSISAAVKSESCTCGSAALKRRISGSQ